MAEFRDPEGVFNNLMFWCGIEHDTFAAAGENEGLMESWAVKISQYGDIHGHELKISTSTRSHPMEGSIVQLVFDVPEYFTFDFMARIKTGNGINIGEKMPLGCPYIWFGDRGNMMLNPEMSLRYLKTVDDYSIEDIEELLLLHNLTRNP